MAKGTFGERLKRERELREVSFDEVSKATRISPRFLEALENEQWDKLPGGVFGRGFVRSIARYLGLSEENLLSEYDLARGESANPGLPRAEERIPSPPKWIPAVAIVALLAVLAGLIAGGRYAWRAYQAHRAQKKSSASLPALAQSQDAATSIASTKRVDVTVAHRDALLLDLNAPAVAPLGAPGSSGTIVVTEKDLRQTTGGDTQR